MCIRDRLFNYTLSLSLSHTHTHIHTHTLPLGTMHTHVHVVHTHTHTSMSSNHKQVCIVCQTGGRCGGLPDSNMSGVVEKSRPHIYNFSVTEALHLADYYIALLQECPALHVYCSINQRLIGCGNI